MCKHTVKKSPFVIRCVLDRYNTQHTFDKAILEKCETSESFTDCYKNV